jgi:hypothetical protein
LEIDLSGRDALEIGKTYRDLGVLCVNGEARCLILKAGDVATRAHFAVRDIFTALALEAGVPEGFRLAIVARAAPVRALYRSLFRELRLMRVTVELFEDDEAARRWLRSAHERKEMATGEKAG